ncbi:MULTISPECIES: PIN domain-containing protein [unclassified Corynebacterium]|uniref:type II toxin-antitoxin system VapC family toxin n=1 Tax=unclassified Corynebacterium TaxID=2624378 RepID=UPI0003B90A6C|nr:MULTISPECIES: PIN domain-containing protein [unclassified Corynebacterium]ERS51128.1 hypothetical protein HMPREF1281_01803 [Corynebacterium sp. KPL1855]ERS61647.1 hypothetical protein HMPREF1257_01886 [Corynebacterium sp. KPL1814]ERS79924.1 hypothetical protein HMPREF1285_01033 [Corynebacterium sp. KPL1859]
MTHKQSLYYIIIDTNAWVTFFSYKANRGDLNENALQTERSEIASNVEALINGNGKEHMLLMPTPIYAELLGIIRGKGKTANKRKKLIDNAVGFLETIDFLFVDLDEQLVKDSEEYMKRYELTGIDACIVAAAAYWGAHYVYTNDKQLLKLENRVSGVRVMAPPEPTQPQLPFSSH